MTRSSLKNNHMKGKDNKKYASRTSKREADSIVKDQERPQLCQKLTSPDVSTVGIVKLIDPCSKEFYSDHPSPTISSIRLEAFVTIKKIHVVKEKLCFQAS